MCVLPKLMIIKNPDPMLINHHQLEKEKCELYINLTKKASKLVSFYFIPFVPCDQSPMSPMSVICGSWLSRPHQQYSNLRLWLRHPAPEPRPPASEHSASLPELRTDNVVSISWWTFAETSGVSCDPGSSYITLECWVVLETILKRHVMSFDLVGLFD